MTRSSWGKWRVVQTATTGGLPEAFDRIQLWTVGRQGFQSDAFGVALPPGLVEPGVVASGIVQYQHHAPLGRSIGPAELAEEIKEGLGPESLRLAQVQKPAVPQAHGAKIADAPPRGVVQQNRIAVLRRCPHAAARAMLLEVHLIQGPQVNAWVGGEPVQLFLRRLAGAGPHGRSVGAVSGGEIRTGETEAGTVAPPGSRRTAVPRAPTAVCHPTDGPPARTAAAAAAERRSLASAVDRSTGSTALDAALLEDLPARELRNGAPNTPPCAASRPIAGPLAGRSLLAPRAARHEVDDRSGIPQSGGSRLAVRARCQRNR